MVRRVRASLFEINYHIGLDQLSLCNVGLGLCDPPFGNLRPATRLGTVDR